MEDILREILDRLRCGATLDAPQLQQLIRSHNRGIKDNAKHYAKKHLIPFYLATKRDDPVTWRSWEVDEELERKLIEALQVKPRRTASGVATITVLTKPWKCGSNCLYCPNDLRMPKSYLSDEPACQRAERNYFDPYLQVRTRLNTLQHMGHTTDKIELIILGGTWSDYPAAYQIWFMAELFRALNDAEALPFDRAPVLNTAVNMQSDTGKASVASQTTPKLNIEELSKNFATHTICQRRAFYEACGIPNTREACADFVARTQESVWAGRLSYNQAMAQLYETDLTEKEKVTHGPDGLQYKATYFWQRASYAQTATIDELRHQQHVNETGLHRVVGLVVETRPDTINPRNLLLIRQMGCTKVQIGIQSLNNEILRRNHRSISTERIRRAFTLLRLFGFKIHAHFMANLLGSTTELDKQDYQRLVEDTAFLPDEIKLYPCALVTGTGLCKHYEDGSWRPYTEEELLDVLTHDVTITPPYIRISRMIRDISAHDIVAGNKKINLRQLVDQRLQAQNCTVREIRAREISTDTPLLEKLTLEDIIYTTDISQEHFLQWVGPDQRIAGFLRLSLPHPEAIEKLQVDLQGAASSDTAISNAPIFAVGEAMIREVHVYGAVAGLHKQVAAQHQGLGKELVEQACKIAQEQGYKRVNVISSVGTRVYYRKLGFVDTELYQQRDLQNHPPLSKLPQVPGFIYPERS